MPEEFNLASYLFDQARTFLLGGLAGAALVWIRKYWHAHQLHEKKFDHLLDVSFTLFDGSRMMLRTQVEKDLRDFFPGDQNLIVLDRIAADASQTEPHQIVLFEKARPKSEPFDRAKHIYDQLRNQLYSQYVNTLTYGAQIHWGEPVETVTYVGTLTKEPQFVCTPSGKDQVTVKIKDQTDPAETKIKHRLLLFTEASLLALENWCEHFLTEEERLDADKRSRAIDQLLQKIGSEKEVTLYNAASGWCGCTGQENDLLDGFIQQMGFPPRPLDRKRYTAMAQVARAVRNGSPCLRLEVPVVRTSGRSAGAARQDESPIEDCLLKWAATGDLSALGGQFFPRDPEGAETRSVRTLSFQPYPEGMENGLSYLGRNGTVTALVTRGDDLLLQWTSHGEEIAWSLPTVFLDEPNPLPAMGHHLINEIFSNEAEPSALEAFQSRVRSARLIYVGPGYHPLNNWESWVVDHVYQIDCSDLDLPLCAARTNPETETESGSKWAPVSQAQDLTLYGTHLQYLAAWQHAKDATDFTP